MLAEVELLGVRATKCVVSVSHSPRPLRFVWHHVQPHEAGGPTTPANLIEVCDSCFTYDTPVRYSQVRRASRRWYAGELVQLALADGRRVSGTPNHPVLTADGWAPLGLLQKGDHVVTDGLDIEPAVPERHVDLMPAAIGKVFDSLAVSGLMRVPGARVDFHGERPDCDVDVVTADGQLRDDLEAARSEFSGYGMFPPADAEPDALPGHRRGGQRLLAAAVAPAGRVGGGGVGLALGGGHPRHAQGVRLAAGAAGYAGGDQETGERASADPGLRGQGVLRFAGQVTALPVTGVRRHPFTGHVYNLQTAAGIYAANGIVVHNCHYSIHRLLWELAQGLTVEKAPRAATLAYARKGFDACQAAGTTGKIPNEG